MSIYFKCSNIRGTTGNRSAILETYPEPGIHFAMNPGSLLFIQVSDHHRKEFGMLIIPVFLLQQQQ